MAEFKLKLREDRPATIDEHRRLREENARLRAALEEISNLGDVRCDEAPLIARRAMGG